MAVAHVCVCLECRASPLLADMHRCPYQISSCLHVTVQANDDLSTGTPYTWLVERRRQRERERERRNKEINTEKTDIEQERNRQRKKEG